MCQPLPNYIRRYTFTGSNDNYLRGAAAITSKTFVYSHLRIHSNTGTYVRTYVRVGKHS